MGVWVAFECMVAISNKSWQSSSQNRSALVFQKLKLESINKSDKKQQGYQNFHYLINSLNIKSSHHPYLIIHFLIILTFFRASLQQNYITQHTFYYQLLYIIIDQIMFGVLAQKVINGFLGEYVEGFNSENLNIGLWRGQVVIQNVKLKSNVIQKFNAPFNIKYSRLGCLKMNIPWSSLSTSKIEVELQGLEIIITQVPQQKWQCKDHRIIQKRKKQIQKFCDSVIEQFAKNASQSAKQVQEKKQGYLGNMLVKIIDNMQITIKNIHIRFQDEITGKFSCGVTLQELKINTVNKAGQPEFIDRTKKQYQNEPLRKKLVLSNLGIYWNEKSQFFKGPDLHQQMVETISQNQKQKNMNYLLLMSFNSMLYLRQAGKQFVDPEINLLLDFDELKVKISNEQLQQIVSLGERLQKYQNEVKAQNRKRLTQLELIANRQIFVKLFPKYFQKKCSAKETSTIEDILQKMQTTNFEEGIKSYLQQKQKQKMIQQKIKKSQGWFSGPKQLTQEQQKQIEKYIVQNFGKSFKPVKRPQDFYYMRVDFNLKALELAITNQIDNKSEQGIRFRLSDIKTQFNLRDDGYMLNFTMNDIRCDIFKRKLNIEEIINVVQKIQTDQISKNKEYVRLQIFGNPLHKKHLNQQIIVRTEELLIQFHPDIIKIAKQFADVKINAESQEAALEALGEIKNKATNVANQFKKPFEKKSFLEIDVKINAITLLLFFDPTKTSEDVWVLKIGQIQVYSDTDTLKKVQFNYDEPMQRYGLTFSKLSFTHFVSKSIYFDTRSKKLSINSNDKILEDLGIDICLELYKNTLDTIPKIKVTAVLHNIELFFNKFNYQSLQKIDKCFSVPQKKELTQSHQKQKMQSKALITKNAKKIGIVYQQSKQPQKYIGVLTGPYLYLYSDKRDVEYKAYYYLKNCEISYNNETSPEKKMFQVVFHNSVNNLVLGFQKTQPMEEWVKAIRNINQAQKQYKGLIQQKQIKLQKKPSIKKYSPNKLNFEIRATVQQVKINTLLSDNKSIQIIINSLDTRTKIYQAKNTVDISLHSIQLTDNIYVYKYQQLNNLLYSSAIQGKSKLIQINLVNNSGDHPDYNNISVHINVEFGKLNCNYKPETVERLMNFYLPKDDEIAAKRKAKGQQLTKQQKQQIEIQRKQRKRQLIQNELKRSAPEVYKIQIKLKIQQISVSLVNRYNKVMFARLGLTGFKYKLGISSRRIVMSGSLEEMWFGDYSCYPETIYQQKQKYTHVDYIIESYNNSRDMLNFSVELIQIPDKNGKSLFVNTSLYDIKASYIQQPVLRVITYLLEQVLPSLTPPQDLTQVKQIPKNDVKPIQSTMILIANVENVLAVVEPRSKQDQYLQMNVSKINVTNVSCYKDYIKSKQTEDQKVLIQQYLIKIQGIKIMQKFRGQQVKLTNDLNLNVSIDLIQNSPYYRKIYGQRFDAGMRIQCQLSPFVMCINHDDYNFIMKCLYWNITYDDNAEGYLFAPPIVRQTVNTQPPSQPLHFGLSMEKIILGVTENSFPLSVLLLNQMRYDLTLDQSGMYMVFRMKHFSGSTICKTSDQKISLERGMFNSFGYQKNHETQKLYNMNNFINIFQRAEQIKNTNQNAVYFSMNTNKKTDDSDIRIKVKDIGIAIEIKRLVTLSKLALLEDYIQPPPSQIIPVRNVGKKDVSKKCMSINIEVDNFLGCLGDKKFENYIVMEGLFTIKMKLWGNKTQQQLTQIAKGERSNGRFLQVSTYQIQAKKYSLYFCNVNDLKNKRFLLLPLNIYFLVRQFYGKINEVIFLETQMDSMVDRVVVQCSVTDLLLVWKIIQDNLETLAEANKVSSITPEIVVNQKKVSNIRQKKIMKQQESMLKTPSKQHSMSIANESVFIDSEPLNRKIKQPTKKINHKTKGTIKLQPIQIRLVNNYGHSSIPVLRFLAEQSCLMFGGNPSKNYYILSPVIKFDFFNPKSASWEPVIQTFQIQVNFKTILTEYGSKMELAITSSEMEALKQLKFNISSQFISSMLTTLQIFNKQKKSLHQLNKVPEIGQISPYIAQNKTNSVIKICRQVQSKKIEIEIKPQQNIKLKIGDSGSGQLLKFIHKGHIYETSLQKFGYVSIPKLKDLHLEFRIDKLNRIICFVEKISIKNATSSKLYCIRYNDKKQKIQTCIQMQPEMAIPVREQWFIQFSFNMKTFTPPTKVFSLTKMYQLIAQSQKFKLSIAERPTILTHSVISIRAPFVISNCLPKDIKLQFISNSKHKYTSQISAQSQHEVFANQNITNIHFKILIQGFYWSNQFWIDFDKLETKDKDKEHYFGGEIQLADRLKGITTIQYKFQVDQQKCQYKLYFSCPAFIVSELEEDIHVYGNPKADEVQKKIERYYQLGGQTQFWKNQQQDKHQKSDRKIDKVILVGTQVGSKLRICGANDCIIDFSEPFEISSMGVHQARVVVQRQIGAKKISVFTMLGIEIQLKKMTMKSNILSKQITVRFRYIISNATNITLFIKQQGSQKLCFHVEPGQKKPFYYTVPAIGIQTRNMIIKSTDTYESLPIASNTLGLIYFRLRLQKKPSSKSSIVSYSSKNDGKSVPQYDYFKLNTRELNSYIFYQFSRAKYEDLPYQVEVRSSKFKVFIPTYQKILVKDSEPFLFINQLPQQAFKMLLLVNLIGTDQSQEVTLQADNLNFEQTFQFSTPFHTRQIFCYIHIVFDDSRKIIVIEEANQQSKPVQHGLQKIIIKIEKLSLSLIHNHSDNLRPYQSFYFYLANLELILLKTNLTSNFQAKLQFLQFDQQQPFNNSDPVILTPQKYKKHTSTNIKNKPLPIFNLVVEIDNTFVKNMFLKRVEVEINNIVVRATTYLIKLIMAMMKQYTQIFRTQAEFFIKKKVNTWKQIDIPEEGSRTFIQNIKIAPFTVLITAFIRVNEQDIQSAFLRTFLNALGVVMTDIDNAPIILYGIELENCIDTFQGIQYKLIQHYKSSVIKQLYKILGSLNIIGNPVSLFRNIATGIKDLKEKPAEGFVSGPLEFGIGLADGTSSLIAHSVGGAFNSVSKATSSLAKAFALLSFDKQFEQTRLKQQMNKPKHVLEGLEKGGKAVFYGFKQGITGVVTQPIEQTKKSGAIGLVKGVGKGLAGLIVKPVTGIVDFASQTTLGLKNTALYLEDKANQNRIRYPRVFYTQNFSVRQYDAVDSKIMSVINRTKYEQKYGFENPMFICAFPINQLQYLVILKQDVALVRIDNDKVEWAIPIGSVMMSKQEGKLRITSDKRRQWYTKKVNALVEFSEGDYIDGLIKIVEELKVNIKDRAINQSQYL